MLSVALMEAIIEQFVASHEGLSNRARIELSFDLPLKRPALISNNSGWRSYPATMVAEHGPEGVRVEMGVRITYSSTCPLLCRPRSSTHSRAPTATRKPSVAPSAQQSSAPGWAAKMPSAPPCTCRLHADAFEVHLASGTTDFDHEDLINMAEGGALKTPVQAAVKREDEQEFARLNGENLLFCEDAGRRLTAALASTKPSTTSAPAPRTARVCIPMMQ